MWSSWVHNSRWRFVEYLQKYLILKTVIRPRVIAGFARQAQFLMFHWPVAWKRPRVSHQYRAYGTWVSGCMPGRAAFETLFYILSYITVSTSICSEALQARNGSPPVFYWKIEIMILQFGTSTVHGWVRVVLQRAPGMAIYGTMGGK